MHLDRDVFPVHDHVLEVELLPVEHATPQDIFLEEPGAIVIRDLTTSHEIRVNLGQCIGLIHALTDAWMVSYYG